MWFKVVLIVLSLLQLGLAAAKECDGVAGVFTAVLKQGVITNSNEARVTREELSSMLEKHLAAAVDEVITNVTTSCQCPPSPIMTQYPLGSTPSFPVAACWEIKNLNPSAPSGYYWLRGTGGSSFHMYCDMSRSFGGVRGVGNTQFPCTRFRNYMISIVIS